MFTLRNNKITGDNHHDIVDWDDADVISKVLVDYLNIVSNKIIKAQLKGDNQTYFSPLKLEKSLLTMYNMLYILSDDFDLHKEFEVCTTSIVNVLRNNNVQVDYSFIKGGIYSSIVLKWDA